MINFYPIPFAGPIPKLELNCSSQQVSCWLESWNIHRRGLIGFFEQMMWTDPPLLMVAAAHSQHFLGAEEGQSASKGSLIHKVLINAFYLIIIMGYVKTGWSILITVSLCFRCQETKWHRTIWPPSLDQTSYTNRRTQRKSLQSRASPGQRRARPSSAWSRRWSAPSKHYLWWVKKWRFKNCKK